MLQSADGVVSTPANALTRGSPPSDPSTPTGTYTTTEAPLGLTERTHNLRKRQGEDEGTNVADSSGGSSVSTECIFRVKPCVASVTLEISNSSFYYA
jgi:hypothetical protein